MSTRFLFGFGLASSLGVEYFLHKLKQRITLLKSLPIHTDESILTNLDSVNNTTHTRKINQSFILSTQFNNSYETIMFLPYFSNLYYLKSDNVLSITSLHSYINPRKLFIEKIFPPFIYLLKLLSISNSKYNFDKLYDQFNFFVGGDCITMFSSRKIQPFYSRLFFQPEIIIQGNKCDLIYYYKIILYRFRYLRPITTIPLVVFICGKVLQFIIKQKTYLPFGNLLNKPGSSYPIKVFCAMCKKNVIQVVFKTCNHFCLCELCFEKQGRKCPLCNVEDSSYIIIS